jgi:glycolate oxidase iron-sulfur subunit
MNLMRWVASLTRFAQRTGLMIFARLFGLGDAAAMAPKIADTYFIANDQHVNVPGAAGTAFLHVGCVMHVAFPQVHEATMRMLNCAGLSVDIPKDQGCCGAIAVHAGDPRPAIEMAKRNIEAFERSGADVYVVNAAGCGSTLKEYGHLLHDEPRWRERAERFSSRVRDITEVLDAMPFRGTPKQMDIDVTYQEPCHLAHAQKVTAAPRRLLARIPGLRLVEMNESAVCCGSAGIYNLTEPEMARSLQERKIENIRGTSATVVATANPGCAMQVANGLKRAGISADVKHIVEILDEAWT